jgi:hypothetical protein
MAGAPATTPEIVHASAIALIRDRIASSSACARTRADIRPH